MHFDLLVVGAGLAGIGFCHHLKRLHPTKSFAILEARPEIGGTWDFFKYPGLRSDVDMHLYGFAFEPWTGEMGVAPAHSIMAYLQRVVDTYGLRPHINLKTRVTRAEWNDARSIWEVDVETPDGPQHMTCDWLQLCAGYYSYSEAHKPKFPGEADFQGQIMHPQFWEDVDLKDKRVVVIGSGATAVTLAPALAKEAEHVTILQRSPTYVFASQQYDPLAAFARKILPAKAASRLVHRKNLLQDRLNYAVARRNPKRAIRKIKESAQRYLKDDFDYDRHFTPTYLPGQQRVCLSPKGDVFKAISAGHLEMVTDEIEAFDETGIILKSGGRIDADIIVTATGLMLEMAGNIPLFVAGERVVFRDHWIYRGIMFSGIPNLAITVGTFVSPYTLRVEMIGKWVSRVLNAMDRKGARKCMPTLPSSEKDMPALPFTEAYTSGYVLRAADTFPRQGDKAPWTNPQSYDDSKRVFSAPLDDGSLIFSDGKADT